MYTLTDKLYESLLDDEDDLIEDKTVLIEQFLKDNYNIDGPYTIKNGIVDAPNSAIKLKNLKLKHLTNDLFKFGSVLEFICARSAITTLKGAPKTAVYFSCKSCERLKTLEGAPEFIDGYFNCSNCSSLISLKGAPKKLTGEFTCIYCNSLKNLNYLPEIEGDLYCDERHLTTNKNIIKKQVKGNIQPVF